MEPISLSIQSVPQYLRVVRCLIYEVAGIAGFSERECDRICLAVDEACSNIIRHSYKGRPDGEIILKCKIEEDGLVVSIRDFGQKFNVEEVKPPDPDNVKPGGLGIHMMKTVMDEVEYDCSNEQGTEVHMTKYIRPEETKDAGNKEGSK